MYDLAEAGGELQTDGCVESSSLVAKWLANALPFPFSHTSWVALGKLLRFC